MVGSIQPAAAWIQTLSCACSGASCQFRNSGIISGEYPTVVKVGVGGVLTLQSLGLCLSLPKPGMWALVVCFAMCTYWTTGAVAGAAAACALLRG